MIDINKIPGFEDTPEKIDNVKDCEKIYKLVGISSATVSFDMFKNAEQFKKLLDNRRELMEFLLLIHDTMYLTYETHQLSIYLEELVEKITGEKWNELNLKAKNHD